MISADCDDWTQHNPVTYVITAYGFYFFDDTATVVIAVGAGTINLALGKPATQSSTFLYHSINPVAGYAHSDLVCLMRLIE
jgi:hypothetical protein